MSERKEFSFLNRSNESKTSIQILGLESRKNANNTLLQQQSNHNNVEHDSIQPGSFIDNNTFSPGVGFTFLNRTDVPKAIVSFLRKTNQESEPAKFSNNQTPTVNKTDNTSHSPKDEKPPVVDKDEQRIQKIVQEENERLNNLARTIKITRPLIPSSPTTTDSSSTTNNRSTRILTQNEKINENKNMLRRRGNKSRSPSPYKHSRINLSPSNSSPRRRRYSRSPSPPPRYNRSISPRHRERLHSPCYYRRSPSPRYYNSRSPSPHGYNRSISPRRYNRSISPPQHRYNRSPSLRHYSRSISQSRRYDRSVSPPRRRNRSPSVTRDRSHSLRRSPLPYRRPRSRSPSPSKSKASNNKPSPRHDFPLSKKFTPLKESKKVDEKESEPKATKIKSNDTVKSSSLASSTQNGVSSLSKTNQNSPAQNDISTTKSSTATKKTCRQLTINTDINGDTVKKGIDPIQ